MFLKKRFDRKQIFFWSANAKKPQNTKSIKKQMTRLIKIYNFEEKKSMWVSNDHSEARKPGKGFKNAFFFRKIDFFFFPSLACCVLENKGGNFEGNDLVRHTRGTMEAKTDDGAILTQNLSKTRFVQLTRRTKEQSAFQQLFIGLII